MRRPEVCAANVLCFGKWLCKGQMVCNFFWNKYSALTIVHHLQVHEQLHFPFLYSDAFCRFGLQGTALQCACFYFQSRLKGDSDSPWKGQIDLLSKYMFENAFQHCMVAICRAFRPRFQTVVILTRRFGRTYFVSACYKHACQTSIFFLSTNFRCHRLWVNLQLKPLEEVPDIKGSLVKLFGYAAEIVQSSGWQFGNFAQSSRHFLKIWKLRLWTFQLLKIKMGHILDMDLGWIFFSIYSFLCSSKIQVSLQRSRYCILEILYTGNYTTADHKMILMGAIICCLHNLRDMCYPSKIAKIMTDSQDYTNKNWLFTPGKA